MEILGDGSADCQLAQPVMKRSYKQAKKAHDCVQPAGHDTLNRCNETVAQVCKLQQQQLNMMQEKTTKTIAL